MLKLHMAACLVATALAAAPAFAQSTAPASPGPSGATDRPAATGSGSTTSGSSAMQPSTGASVGTQSATGGTASGAGAATGVSETPASGSAAAGSSNSSGSASTSSSASATPPSPTAGASGASSTVAGGSGFAGQVMTHQQPGQWLASKLIGTTVVGPNNESIGDVNDVLMERDGHAAAVIVGVGGFLGDRREGRGDLLRPYRADEPRGDERLDQRAEPVEPFDDRLDGERHRQRRPGPDHAAHDEAGAAKRAEVHPRRPARYVGWARHARHCTEAVSVGSVGERGGAAPPLSARKAAGQTNRHIKKRGWV